MPSKVHTARVAHHTAGRLRLKLATGKRNQPLLEEIRLLLKPRPGVKDVSVNTTTGSVLIHYDAGKWRDARAELEQAANISGLFTLAEPGPDVIKSVEKEAQFLAEHSDAARAAVDFVKDVNQSVKRATNNAVDLNVLVPLGAAIYSFLQLESEAATPLWLTLGIFSFNSFVALHSHNTQRPSHV